MPKEPDEPSVRVPWNVILPLLAGLLGGGAATGASNFASAESSEQINALTVQVIEMRSDIKAIGLALREVKEIEESAHPRTGVPPRGPFSAPEP